ncbi:MAG: hypothetical protein U9R26_05015 [Campylobacterota bacterium]|nr:hypothetical protein [Campylobacterota bacterium]
MHILLVNTNPVVSRLFSLNTRDDAAIHIDEVVGGEMIPETRYDVVFIDEKCCDAEAAGVYLEKVRAGEKILFSSRKGSAVDGIDRVITKPFLPSEIAAVLQSILKNKGVVTGEEEDFLAPVESREVYEDSEKEKNLILDSQEIDIIKQLLVNEELEVAENEESEVESESMIVEEHKSNPKKRNKPKKKKENKEVSKTKEKKMRFEESLLEALVEMKPKKIRKLLEDAEVSITIRFPKGV